MDQARAIWIRDPLAILADGAERGIVVQGGRIVELVGKGREPATAHGAVYDAGAHVVLPGLINTHHHFYQTLTRALPAAMDRELFPWLQACARAWHLSCRCADSRFRSAPSRRSRSFQQTVSCGGIRNTLRSCEPSARLNTTNSSWIHNVF